MKVLVVDDNPADRLLMKKILEHHGCEVVEAEDGQRGLELAGHILPDAIISDALMPRMDGFQLLREVRHREDLKATLFIFYTANYAGAREAELAQSLGADRFIVKPTDPEGLWNILSGLFAGRVRKRAASPPPAAIEDEGRYLAQYSSIVASKLEEKVHELEKEIVQRKEAEERFQALSKSLIGKLEMERRHIARELHDEIGQVLTAIKMNIQTLQRSPGGAEQPALFAESISGVDRALQHVRDLSLALRPALLDDLGLQAALRWLTDKTARASGLAVQYEGTISDQRMPLEVETACFRIAQEALNNVVRHARARRASVELHRDGGRLELVVRDDGSAFDVQKAFAGAVRSESFGLLGMRERAMLAGGNLEISSNPGEGTIIRALFLLS